MRPKKRLTMLTSRILRDKYSNHAISPLMREVKEISRRLREEYKKEKQREEPEEIVDLLNVNLRLSMLSRRQPSVQMDSPNKYLA